MEHDIEKIIQEKVKASEQKSVHWEKDEVWSKIGTELKPKKKVALYYAAASVILVTTLTVLFLELDKRNQLDQQLKSLELALEQKEAKQIMLADENKTRALEDCSQPLTKATQQRKVHRKAKSTKYSEPIINPALISVSEENSITIEKVLLNTLPENETAVVKLVKPVHAIFGLDKKQTIASVSKKEKKLRLRLFRSEDDKGPIQIASEPINLLARVNKN